MPSDIATVDATDDADRWFLARGMPAVLPSRARRRDLVARSAPALTAYAIVVTALLVVYFLIGTSEVYIDGPPTPVERVVLTVIVLAVPLAALVGWLVSRLHSRRAQLGVGIAAVVVAVIAGVIQGGRSHLVGTSIVVLAVLALTAVGAGAVLAWAMRLTVTQFAATADVSHDDSHQLADTPFSALPDPPVARTLTRAERFNVVLVLTAAQITHLMVVAISTAAIYFLLGVVLLSLAVLARWTANGTSDGTILGMAIPVPQSLIHMTMLLIALTFMYVSARSATDDEFKSRFLDPLIEDLHVTLVARNRDRGALG